MSITLEQKKLVQETWEKVVPIAETAAELFYGRLFEIDPELKPLFKNADMKEQKMKLLQMLGMAVKGLDNLDQLVPAVENLGRRHVGYGVKDSLRYRGRCLVVDSGKRSRRRLHPRSHGSLDRDLRHLSNCNEECDGNCSSLVTLKKKVSFWRDLLFIGSILHL